jgi:hypothetical protein
MLNTTMKPGARTMSTIQLRPPGWLRFARFCAERLTRVLTAAPSASPRPFHDELVELDARTLQDIGASDALLAKAHWRRDAQRREHDQLRRGISAGGWSTRW